MTDNCRCKDCEAHRNGYRCLNYDCGWCYPPHEYEGDGEDY